MQLMALMFAGIFLALWPARMDAQSVECPGDFNGDSRVTVNEVMRSVNDALHGCKSSPRLVDNGDGTITDTKTRLQWEKKSFDGSIHDVGNQYAWSTGAPYNPDGNLFTGFLATLNQAPCFAGQCDWRIPTMTELQSLITFSVYSPATDPIFDTNCVEHCKVTGCSCINLDWYWSATTSAQLADSAWSVNFDHGSATAFDKTLPLLYARAVRGGL